MRKSIIVGLLCLALFLATCVGGIVATVSQKVSHIAGTETKSVWPSGDDGGSVKPFVRLCGDEGGSPKPFNNQTGP